MEKTNNVTMGSEDLVIDVASKFQDFSSSWTVLQHSSKNTDDVDAINRLLKMYEPDDGIAAYERVLKTVFALSENLDNNTRQQIISLIPLPRRVSDNTIRDVILKITGLVVTNVSGCHKIPVVPEGKLEAKVSDVNVRNVNQSQDILSGITSQKHESNVEYRNAMECKNSSKLVSSTSDVFRGFPRNEISKVHTRVQNANHVYDTLNYHLPCLETCADVRKNTSPVADQQTESSRQQSNLKLKWFHAPRLLYKNNPYQGTASCQRDFFKSMHNKYFQVPVNKINNYNQTDLANTIRPFNQGNMCFEKNTCDNEMVLKKQDKNEILNLGTQKNSFTKSSGTCCQFFHTTDVNQETRSSNSNMNETKTFNAETLQYFGKDIKTEQRAIQEDINKMDFVRWGEDNENLAMDTHVPQANNFAAEYLIANKQLKMSIGHFLDRAEQDISTQVLVLPQTKSLCTTTTGLWNLATTHGSLEYDRPLDFKLEDDKEVVSKNAKKFIQRPSSGPAKIGPNPEERDSPQLQAFQKNAENNCRKKVDVENSSNRYPMKSIQQNNAKVLQQAASITELSTFKKQYYDTLLSIQKAKVAVANSLAISSVESSTRYDPYYASYSYQQQQLLQQQRQLTVSPQFAVHTMPQSGLSSMHGAPYAWVKCNNWRQPMVRQLKLQPQSLCLYSRNKDENSPIPQHVETLDAQRTMQDEHKQTKQCVQRKKLEDIVGKLKEVENGNVNT